MLIANTVQEISVASGIGDWVVIYLASQREYGRQQESEDVGNQR